MLTRASLTAQDLARILEQSADCVKLLDRDGSLIWMNANGLCAMEIDTLDLVEGKRWSDLWSKDAQTTIEAAFETAKAGRTARFREGCPTAKGTSRFWEVSVTQVHDDRGEPIGFLSISRDITQSENDREALRVIIAEMRHRLKNSYTIVCSLLRRFAGSSPELREFAADMEQRILALARAQSLFDDEVVTTDLRQLIDVLVTPFMDPLQNCFAVTVPYGIALNQRRADAVALVIGELCINSAKYGALEHGGKIDIDWTGNSSAFQLQWIEHSLIPPTSTYRVGGQGLNLIDRIVTACSGKLEMLWKQSGLTVSVSFPTHT